MERNESYKTAYVAAYARLMEQYEPEGTRLFNDSFVKDFFGNYLSYIMQFKFTRNLMISMYNATSPGLFGLQVCRTKYIDEKLKEAIDSGIEQVVILGAGLDTRLYRIANTHRIRGFEVDLQIMQDKKKVKVKKCLGQLPDNIGYIPIDFNVQTPDEVLEIKELDFSKPIFFIWEGVTQYITEEAFINTLKFISKASSGSSLIFSYLLASVVDGTSDNIETEVLTTLFKTADQAWIFGLNPLDIENFIKQYGLELIEDVGASYYENNYLKPICRKLDVSSIERIAYARII